MRITRITLNNWLGIPSFDHELTEPVLFIAGGNGAGKTSLLEGIRFALTGQQPRGVKKVADRALLVTEGGTSGFAGLSLGDESFQRSITTAKTTGDEPALPPGIELCLEASGFATMPEADRRKLLFGLAGVEINKETAAAHLRQSGVPDSVIAEVVPKLSGGFPAAAAHAKESAASARGAWKAITGEAYGSQKAETWRAEAEGERPTDEEIADAKAAVQRHDARILELTQAVGRAEAAVPTERVQELQDIASGLPRAEEELRSAEAVYDDAQAAVARIEALSRGSQPTVHACPACSASLVIDGRGLALADEDAAPPPAAPSAALQKAKVAAHDAYQELQACRRAAQHHRSAQTTLESLPPPPSDEDLQAGPLLEEERRRSQLARDLHRLLVNKRDEHAQAQNKTDAARAHHADVVDWTTAEKALGPDGIPAILLARALDPINSVLARHAQASGWQVPAIRRDLSLEYGGRDYALVSESEQWRADAMFAAAIAELSGCGLLVLDRFDVLEPAARGDALDWLCSIAGAEVATVIVAGTLKDKPDLGEGIDVVWLSFTH